MIFFLFFQTKPFMTINYIHNSNQNLPKTWYCLPLPVHYVTLPIQYSMMQLS